MIGHYTTRACPACPCYAFKLDFEYTTRAV